MSAAEPLLRRGTAVRLGVQRSGESRKGGGCPMSVDERN
jgi:hypothetical protein